MTYTKHILNVVKSSDVCFGLLEHQLIAHCTSKTTNPSSYRNLVFCPVFVFLHSLIISILFTTILRNYFNTTYTVNCIEYRMTSRQKCEDIMG